jgi:predicted Zn-dependent protease
MAAIAADVLTGRAALITHAPDEAVAAFARGAERQEQTFPYARRFDPPPWWYPVRRSLAYADLAAGKPSDAAREAQASLKDWPDDALALRVLADAEAELGEARAAAQHWAEARHAWRGDLDKMPMTLT